MDTGKIIGGVLIIGATVAVWMWPDAKQPIAQPEMIRPIRSAIVKANSCNNDLSLVGTVKAKDSRKLTFKQSGRLQKVTAKKGELLKKGDKVAWLDPLDFENRLAQAEAAVKRDRLTFKRKSDAAKKNAISQEELSQSEAQLKQSEAEYALAKRALDETVIYAPFDCTVADVPVDELEIVDASKTIVAIQDLSKVRVDVVYPESIIIRAKSIRSVSEDCDDGVFISFDSMPGKSYPAKFVDYTGTADKQTQTFIATYEMAAPEDVFLLPGMSATLTVKGDKYTYDGEDVNNELAVPECALGTDAAGRSFVWKLIETAEKGVYEAHSTIVEAGWTQNGLTDIISGLKAGDRVAAAGVTILSEGRKVRLLKE